MTDDPNETAATHPNACSRRALLGTFAGATLVASGVPSANAATRAKAIGSFNTFDRYSQRPTNLTPADAGLMLLFTQTGNFHLWTGTAWKVQNESFVNVKDYGATGDSIADDTEAIRRAISRATDFYRQIKGKYPLSYGPLDSSTVLFPHGNYRVTDTIVVTNGLTLAGVSDQTYTVATTRIIMDTRTDANETSPGGKKNLDKHIFTFTRDIAGVGQPNANLTVTIVDLEFWIMNPGSRINVREGEGWPEDSVNDNLGVYGACCIYIDVPCVDSRIKRCNFYSTPNAAIYFNQSTVGATSNCFIDACEFDTPRVAIRCNNSNLDVTINNCEFFDNTYIAYAANCTGKVQLIGNQIVATVDPTNRIVASPRLSVKESCRLTAFGFSSNRVDLSPSGVSINLNNCETINISANLFTGPLAPGAIKANDCAGGVIASNSISNCGFGYSGGAVGNELGDPAVIRLSGCSGVVVSANSITTPIDGIYNGFGILTLDSALNVSRCLVSNNLVSSKYNTFGAAPTLYRNQNRWVNLSKNDQTLGGNAIV
jgi:Pectate lyase superfamily protein